MEESVRLGRIAGIPVGINWSVLVVLWLICWSLAVGYLPDADPGHSTGAYWLAGILAAVTFLASLLAHEVAHAVVASRSGLEVSGITLWLLGGVSKLESEPATPRAEFEITVVGPGTSLALAALFGACAAILDAAGAPSLLITTGVWLATVNGMLGLFNLVPAAPLDGGRLLRAWVWHRTGDHLRATETAAAAGRVFGFVLIGLGLLEFAAGLGIGGLWFVFLGWFLITAARAEQTQAVTLEALSHLRVQDLMTSSPVVVRGDMSAQALLDDVMMRHRCSAFPVVDADGRTTGLITLSRVKGLPVQRRSVTKVDDIATPLREVAVATPEEPAVDLVERLAPSGDGRALVFLGSELVGIVSPTDVLRVSQVAAVNRRRIVAED